MGINCQYEVVYNSYFVSVRPGFFDELVSDWDSGVVFNQGPGVRVASIRATFVDRGTRQVVKKKFICVVLFSHDFKSIVNCRVVKKYICDILALWSVLRVQPNCEG